MSDQANYQLPIHNTDDSSSTIDVTVEPTTLNEKDLADQPLQPPDGGRGWLVVFGSFLVSLFVIGFGVVMAEYKVIHMYQTGFIFHVGFSVISRW